MWQILILIAAFLLVFIRLYMRLKRKREKSWRRRRWKRLTRQLDQTYSEYDELGVPED